MRDYIIHHNHVCVSVVCLSSCLVSLTLCFLQSNRTLLHSSITQVLITHLHEAHVRYIDILR